MLTRQSINYYNYCNRDKAEYRKPDGMNIDSIIYLLNECTVSHEWNDHKQWYYIVDNIEYYDS